MQSLTPLELGLLVLVILLVIYLFYLAYNDKKQEKDLKVIDDKIRSLIDGDYSGKLSVLGEDDIQTLGTNLNDLSDMFRMTHETLAQERNRLVSILTYMSDGVLATDRSGNITMMNSRAQEQLGISQKDALDKPIVEVLGVERYTFDRLVDEVPDLKIHHRNAYDEFLTFRITFALLRRENGFVSGLVAVLHDVTQQEKEERERQLFVSTVSHELRTPLTSIKSYLEALNEGALTEDVAPTFVRVSLDEANRMMRMISELLDLSHAGTKKRQVTMELTNFTAFLSAILDRFDRIKSQSTVGHKKYEIRREFDNTPIWVEIDNDRMTRVIDNIMNNAIKYSPNGGCISVHLRTTDTQMILSISDQGLGIPQEELPMIFDRFYRVDRARSRAQGGTGLGLAIAKEIVKEHDGFIWASSDYGKGSTFTVVLPYDKDSEVLDEEWEEEE